MGMANTPPQLCPLSALVSLGASQMEARASSSTKEDTPTHRVMRKKMIFLQRDDLSQNDEYGKDPCYGGQQMEEGTVYTNDLPIVFINYLDGGEAGRALPCNLDRTLMALWQSGRAKWPDVDVDAALFTRHLAERIPQNANFDQTLDTVCAADLYIACACTYGREGAVNRFEAMYSRTISAAIRGINNSETFIDEARAILRNKLFMPTPEAGRPVIASYGGRGRLASWVKVTAVRVAQNLQRRTNTRLETSDDTLADALPAGADPELDYLRASYQAQFEEAFKAALAKLTEHQRMLLKLLYVSRLSQEEIAHKYTITQGTIAKRLRAAREDLLQEIRRYFREHLKMSTSEFNSIAHLIMSQLHLSLIRLLGE
jgi:RNA polymerase sigma-70 factor (ECF subfamily)